MYFNSLKKFCSNFNVRISESSYEREHQNLIPIGEHKNRGLPILFILKEWLQKLA